MSEQEIAELRSRIADLENKDADFARKSNILLDNILLNGEQIERNTAAIAENRRDIDQLADRIGNLAEEADLLRQERREDIRVMVNIVDTLSSSIRGLREFQEAQFQQINVDRTTWQGEIQRIWEYLLRQNPNNGHRE